jgi:hypothetical protein
VVDGAAGVWLLAASNFGWSLARCFAVGLSLLKEEAAVLINGAGVRSKDSGIVRKDRGEAR